MDGAEPAVSAVERPSVLRRAANAFVWTIVVLFFVGVALVALQFRMMKKSVDAGRARREAMEAARDGSWNFAVKRFTDGLDAAPDNLVLRCGRAEALLETGDLEGARQDIELAFAADPKSPDALAQWTRGRLRLRGGDVDGACEDMHLAISSGRTNSGWPIRFDLGARDLDAVLARPGADPRLKVLRARIEWESRMTPTGETLIRRLLDDALREKPDLADARALRGLVEIKAGERQAGEADLKAAVEGRKESSALTWEAELELKRLKEEGGAK